MDDTTTLPAPDLASAHASPDAWERERRAFLQMLPALQSTHSGRYVAIHGGTIVAGGFDQVEVARRAYDQVGYVPVYVGLVTDEPMRPVRLPSPRLLRDARS